MNRTHQQWLLMIERTQKSAFAIDALKTQLERERNGLSESEYADLWQRLLHLEPEREPSKQAGVVNVDYRPEGMGGKGRVYLEVGGRTMRELVDNEALDALQVYAFFDADKRFAGLQIDAANSLLERFSAVLRGLADLQPEPLDCPEANLTNATLGQILEWVVRRYF